MAHKRMRQYTSDETSNILMGQTGFVIVPASKKIYLVDGVPYISAHNDSGAAAALTDITVKCNQFPMIRVIDAGDIAAQSILGDHFSTTGAEPTSGTYNSIKVAVELADTYYGAFDEVWTGIGTILMVYLG
jgi:hypothetical protein